jgi:hypothetical protein
MTKLTLEQFCEENDLTIYEELSEFLDGETDHDTFTDDEIEVEFEQYLDELHGDIDICGFDYSASYTLKQVDPTAFRTDMNDWSDQEFTEISTGIYVRREDFNSAESEMENHNSDVKDQYNDYLENLEKGLLE